MAAGGGVCTPLSPSSNGQVWGCSSATMASRFSIGLQKIDLSVYKMSQKVSQAAKETRSSVCETFKTNRSQTAGVQKHAGSEEVLLRTTSYEVVQAFIGSVYRLG